MHHGSLTLEPHSTGYSLCYTREREEGGEDKVLVSQNIIPCVNEFSSKCGIK